MPSPAQLAALAAVVPAAQASAHRWGVPASVTLAQWILESGWGSTALAVQAHNYFGIKATQGQDYQEFPTREVIHGVSVMEQAMFARYLNAAACFDAHGKLLATVPRYAPAMHEQHDIASFCSELQICGYSTSPIYARSLLVLIGELKLQQYDLPVAA